jgi:hypothetical protein
MVPGPEKVGLDCLPVFQTQLFCPLSLNFVISAFDSANLKFFCSILVPFEFKKIWSHNIKAMVKDKKVNIAVT